MGQGSPSAKMNIEATPWGGGGSGTQKSKSLCTKNSPNQYFLV